MAYAFIGFFACLVCGWIYSEVRDAASSTRIALGGSAILILCAVIYASEVGDFYRNAHNAAAIRMLGEALDDGDIDNARNAINKYNASDSQQTGYVIVEFLSNRKRESTD
jgi:hypothetical protein